MKSKGELTCAGLLALALSVQLHASDFQVSEQGAHHKVFQRQDLDDTGQIKVHQYIELADGLSYWDSVTGAWADSVAEFEAFKNQGFVARRGQIRVILSPTLQSGGLDINTPAGRFRGHCLGLSYFDSATGQSVTLATMRSVEGEQVGPTKTGQFLILTHQLAGVGVSNLMQEKCWILFLDKLGALPWDTQLYRFWRGSLRG